MHEFYLILGITIVIIIAFDFFYTTVSINGAGLLARYVSSGIAAIFLWINRKTQNRWLFQFSGMIHILALVTLWLAFLWMGFFLLLMGDPNSVIHPASGAVSDTTDKIYFSGYTLSTLGNGEYVPGDGIWQIVVAGFSFAGFIFITTAMSYLISLTSAVIHKKNLSLFISNLGETPEKIVNNTFNGDDFKQLEKIVPELQQMINKHNQNHFAHPGVHYFYSRSRSESLAINISNLDEALTIIHHHVDKSGRWNQQLRPLRDAISKFLDTIQHHFAATHKLDLKDSLPLNYLQSSEIPLVESAEISQAVQERRALLAGLLRSTGWSWSDIYKNSEPPNK
jgi:hypothetical protein